MLLVEKKTDNNTERFAVYQTVDAIDVQNNPIIVKQQLAELTSVELEREIADTESKLAYLMDIKTEIQALELSGKTKTAYVAPVKKK